MRKDTAGYVLAPIGAAVGAACGIALGFLVGALLGTAHMENFPDDAGLMEVILTLFVAFLILQLMVPLLGAVGCGLGCYVALRMGRQTAALRTAGFTLAFVVASSFVAADSMAWLTAAIVVSALLGRRVAVGSVEG